MAEIVTLYYVNYDIEDVRKIKVYEVQAKKTEKIYALRHEHVAHKNGKYFESKQEALTRFIEKAERSITNAYRATENSTRERDQAIALLKEIQNEG